MVDHAINLRIMRLSGYFITGIVFGIIMTKSEAISWFRIHEMFRFESIHMYGIIGVAVGLGALGIYLMKKFRVRTLLDTPVEYATIKFNLTRHLLAGSIFGLGWALMGACPGPMFVMLGHGFWIFIVTIFGALMGTFLYGLIKDHLPH